jgi:hypothetical protein
MASLDGTGEYKPWFERWPERKEAEKRRFEAHGFPWTEDQASTSRGYL